MRRFFLFLVSFLPVSATAQPSHSPPEAGSEHIAVLVDRWITLQQTRHAETRAWKQEQADWQREVALLKQEQTLLARTLADVQAPLPDSATGETSAAALEQVVARLATVDAALHQAAADLAARRQRVPPPLRDALPAAPPATGSSTRRLQQVLRGYAALHTLHHRLHVASVMLPDGDSTRRHDALYLGLARAVAVAPDDSSAYLGRPEGDTWRWTPLPGEATTVREALRMHAGEAPPRYLPLPLEAGP